jgi:hypothetical protein
MQFPFQDSFVAPIVDNTIKNELFDKCFMRAKMHVRKTLKLNSRVDIRL